MMQRIPIALLIVPLLLSCQAQGSPSLEPSSFPLEHFASIPVGDDIQEIAAGDDWIAAHTANQIVAIDTASQQIMWTEDFPVMTYGNSFAIVDNHLIAASYDQVIVMDRRGHRTEMPLEPTYDSNNVIKILTAVPDYLYVVRGPDWTLEAYDLDQGRKLWHLPAGRHVGKVYYDPSRAIAYLTTDESLRAIDNPTGKVLWEIRGKFGDGAISDDVLYIRERVSDKEHEHFSAIDLATQRKLWEADIGLPPGSTRASLTVIDNLLISAGDQGMTALNTASGEHLWTSPNVGEELYTRPVEFDGVIYAKGLATGAVYAISPRDGSVIGRTEPTNDSLLFAARAGLDTLSDGILFNTAKDLAIYKSK